MSLTDRIAAAFRDLVREMLAPDATDANPAWAYFVPWEYQVASVTDTTFTGRATSSRCPLPDAVGIPLFPGVAGTLLKPALGSLVAVAFLNGDPSKPRVVGWDQAVPQSVGLAGNGPAVHRVGDLGTAGTITTDPPGPAGTAIKIVDANNNVCLIPIVFSGGSVVVGPAVPPVFTWATKATTGSSIVKAGG